MIKTERYEVMLTSPFTGTEFLIRISGSMIHHVDVGIGEDAEQTISIYLSEMGIEEEWNIEHIFNLDDPPPGE